MAQLGLNFANLASQSQNLASQSQIIIITIIIIFVSQLQVRTIIIMITIIETRHQHHRHHHQHAETTYIQVLSTGRRHWPYGHLNMCTHTRRGEKHSRTFVSVHPHGTKICAHPPGEEKNTDQDINFDLKTSDVCLTVLDQDIDFDLCELRHQQRQAFKGLQRCQAKTNMH